ncbi:hypothetical protein BZA05DRAFT_412331 [Tricharina praecox]|uniref:uncharacterized protein n=1 Tax=Tricharina praecox TaxID=43433 RepID=UPI00221E4F2D|nr:uncharacterized protein BZA05DRAFT_412331 [Tricharina praecox]KAI5842315.1 hypothetical protein BZA05DRAFT_412331 [Tricharina praecox]
MRKIRRALRRTCAAASFAIVTAPVGAGLAAGGGRSCCARAGRRGRYLWWYLWRMRMGRSRRGCGGGCGCRLCCWMGRPFGWIATFLACACIGCSQCATGGRARMRTGLFRPLDWLVAWIRYEVCRDRGLS